MENTTKPSRFSFNYLVLIVVMALLCFSAYTYYESNHNERLFLANFEPAENSYINLRGESSTATELNKAMDFYVRKDFEAALPHFENYLAIEKNDFKAMLYAGISHLEVLQLSKSIDLLETTRINAPQYFEAAGWYLALAHIRNEQLPKARRILQETAKSETNNYSKQAQELLNSMP